MKLYEINVDEKGNIFSKNNLDFEDDNYIISIRYDTSFIVFPKSSLMSPFKNKYFVLFVYRKSEVRSKLLNLSKEEIIFNIKYYRNNSKMYCVDNKCNIVDVTLKFLRLAKKEM